jgi:transcriptional regulator with XRE-family HTH domain
MTFGRVIREARQRAGLSQRDLAARIMREDDRPISPQYLNDLERDRRNPPDYPLLRQFADVLDLPSDYLAFVAGRVPEDLLTGDYDSDAVAAAFRALRAELQRQRAR